MHHAWTWLWVALLPMVAAAAPTFTLSGVPGDPTFKGALDATGKKITGAFTQGGAAGTFAVDKQ